MNSRDVVGKRIVGVVQGWKEHDETDNGRSRTGLTPERLWLCTQLVLEDGTRVCAEALETEQNPVATLYAFKP